MSEMFLERISEETGCDLTPLGIAPDQMPRALHES